MLLTARPPMPRQSAKRILRLAKAKQDSRRTAHDIRPIVCTRRFLNGNDIFQWRLLSPLALPSVRRRVQGLVRVVSNLVAAIHDASLPGRVLFVR
jgi:hypothetical protein